MEPPAVHLGNSVYFSAFVCAFMCFVYLCHLKSLCDKPSAVLMECEYVSHV